MTGGGYIKLGTWKGYAWTAVGGMGMITPKDFALVTCVSFVRHEHREREHRERRHGWLELEPRACRKSSDGGDAHTKGLQSRFEKHRRHVAAVANTRSERFDRR